jgi:peptidoglycan/xylan/chitin deacetylase (PgdA/CDA1 family)
VKRRKEKAKRFGVCSLAAVWAFSAAASGQTPPPPSCKATAYLTLDTGHMGPAEEMAAILRKHAVKATFFLANEKTRRGDTSLDPAWGAYWKARAGEGHAFGSHTWRHWYFQGDEGDVVLYAPYGEKRARQRLDSKAMCDELKKPEEAFRAMTGRGFDALWRAPGGKLTPNATRFAEACGFKHVPWSPAGFSGDELASDRFPSDKLIAQQLAGIRDGDILLWHLGIWSRKDPLWPKLDDLIAGLKSKGFCFARITEHPAWKR